MLKNVIRFATCYFSLNAFAVANAISRVDGDWYSLNGPRKMR
jgi:hypothetical protein